MNTEREQVEALADLMQEAAELPQLDGARLILNSALLAEVKAAARAEHGERIAQAIEALPLDDGGWPVGEYDMRTDAARIARSTP